ncbi:chemotaxis protein CheB [Pseudomonas lopnurensis]|uniref:chemotaxis protein CheB n=1 Tax=Pseudomonas lopnurensis TaxID=1477517 RepID=UPI0028B0A699|nr:chemotaxis protein CheB [Pseudomonas lopnurensis]
MRVLVVDDSPVACMLLCAILESAGIDSRIAESGEQALDILDSYTPDIVTMDVNMPGMDGYATTARILQKHALPVVVLTASAQVADAAIRALEAGALAVIQKPAGPEAPDFDQRVDELLRTLRVMSQVKIVRRSSTADRMPSTVSKRPPPESTDIPKIVGIAASAGGPAALKTLLQRLNPAQPWPILLVQHIAAGFIDSFREWLERIAPIPVKVAEANQPLERGVLYLAPDDCSIGVTCRNHVQLESCRPEQLICPSADHLFHSMAKALGQSAIGIQLSGMGRDGASGLLDLKNHGALTLVQQPSDAVIDSMPRTAIDMHAACEVLPAEQIADMLNTLARQYLNDNRPRQGR